MRFTATLQPRTPLYVLERHGLECAPDKPPPPDFPFWAGIWSFKAKGIDEIFGTAGLDERLRPKVGATHIGLQSVDEYLPFLKAFRQIIESDVDDTEVIRQINALRSNNRWAHYIEDHGGAGRLLAVSGEPRRPAA